MTSEHTDNSNSELHTYAEVAKKYDVSEDYIFQLSNRYHLLKLSLYSYKGREVHRLTSEDVDTVAEIMKLRGEGKKWKEIQESMPIYLSDEERQKLELEDKFARLFVNQELGKLD